MNESGELLEIALGVLQLRAGEELGVAGYIRDDEIAFVGTTFVRHLRPPSASEPASQVTA